MRIFVADPSIPIILDNVTRLFPEYTKDQVRDKISRTGDRLLEAADQAGVSKRRLEFYYVPYLLNYSIQCIDNKILVLSIFEMYRKSKIDSPAIVLDLSKSAHLTNYWKKELKGILEASAKIYPK